MPRHPIHHHPEWYEVEEKEKTLNEIGERLVKIGDLLKSKGGFKLGNSQIRPSDPSFFILRYERMPRGELSIKIEIIWEEGSKEFPNITTRSDELPISEI